LLDENKKGGTDQSASQRLSLDRHSLPNRERLFIYNAKTISQSRTILAKHRTNVVY
jgi:hypothetical protein